VFAGGEVVSGGRDELAVSGHTSDNLLLRGSHFDAEMDLFCKSSTLSVVCRYLMHR